MNSRNRRTRKTTVPSANDNPKQLDLTAAVEIDLAADQRRE